MQLRVLVSVVVQLPQDEINAYSFFRFASRVTQATCSLNGRGTVLEEGQSGLRTLE